MRATVSVEHSDGSIEQIVVENNGSLDECGRLLYFYYNSLEKAESLIAMGDCMKLGINTWESQFYYRDYDEPECLARPYYYENYEDYLKSLSIFDNHFLFTENDDYYNSRSDAWVVRCANGGTDFKRVSYHVL